MNMAQHLIWSGIIVLFTTCSNLPSNNDGRSGYNSGGTYIGTGGWSSAGHK